MKDNNQIVRLTSVGLTNQPNLYLTALNHQQIPQEDDMPLKNVAKTLGLPEDASSDAVLAATQKAFNLELETKIGKPISGNNFKKIKMAKVHSDECSKALKELADSIGEILDDDEDNNTSDQEGKPKEEAKPKEPVKSVEDLEAHFTALHDELKAEMKTMYEHTQSALTEIAEIKKSLEPLTSDFVLRNLKLKHNL
jgi:flagellar motility protein MotE (MotC chaperone)